MESAATIRGRVRNLVGMLSAEERLELIHEISDMGRTPGPAGSAGQDAALEQEQAAWYDLPAAEPARYRGEFVAVQDGEVVDHGQDRRALYLRTHRRYHDTNVLIVSADWAEPPVYRVDSPQLER